MVESRQQYVEEMFKEVVKSFPIKEDEIKITYIRYWHLSAGYSALNKKKTKKEYKIFTGYNFFSFLKEEQEGILAHEIGHYKIMKNWSIKRIKRNYKWRGMFFKNQIPNDRPHWKERLKKWYVLNETAADNQIAKTKYGKIRLESYKKHLSLSNEVNQAVISNLEQKLGVKK